MFTAFPLLTFLLTFFSTFCRDIVQYLRHKASPTVRRVSSMAEITPYLEQFESGEMHEQGLFSIVLGLFMPPDENDLTKVPIWLT